MKTYLKFDEWCIIEEGFKPENHQKSESLFSIGNGRMGQRANFEETYSGDSLQGSYVGGVYYPDKTRVGWWKNGYPEYFAKVLNSVNWIGINVNINNHVLDLHKVEVTDFKRVLNMKEGLLQRSFVAIFPNGNKIRVEAKRFISMHNFELGVVKYTVEPLNFSGTVEFEPYLDFDVMNEDANYDEKFWVPLNTISAKGEGYVTAKTKKTDFVVCAAQKIVVLKNDNPIEFEPQVIQKEQYASNQITLEVKEGETLSLEKHAGITSSLNHDEDNLIAAALKVANDASLLGYTQLFENHKNAWLHKWEESDVEIKGDVAAQQAIRFNIFQLYNTYTGDDDRLNIGPKGFTGEKYGGSTYWDTEAYCLPFYMSTADERVAKNLLIYRYKQLDKAIENAEKLGFSGGAALYPMVTMNGEECHNEWEITFEEIHRNGAIAFAIYNYINYTGKTQYLANYGMEVLIGIARFWAQRVNFSGVKQKYVMLGVTGPNEYENNVNNNWYTNKIAMWCLKYTIEAIEIVKSQYPDEYACIVSKTHFHEDKETAKWAEIRENMFFPEDTDQGIFIQQEGFLDKTQQLAKDLDPAQRPINQKWSWDRILRSVFIKQADVLQGIYLFEDEFDLETIKRNFYFYEARTVHESSLSPCIHSILASKINNPEKAYELYLRTARLDLDDYNSEVAEGCHITSMAGTWMTIVQGFGGMRTMENKLSFRPFLPEKWESLSFKIKYRGSLLSINMYKQKLILGFESPDAVTIRIFDKEHVLRGTGTIEVYY